MEVGKAAALSPPRAHYARRWDAIGPKDPFYSADIWRDRAFDALTPSSAQAWNECSATSASSHSPSASSGLPADGSVDRVLFHNLVEMIPLVEEFMEQKQSSRSFSRHSSLVYTPNPRDVSKPSEHILKAKKGHGQRFKDNLVDQNTIIAQLQDQVEILEQRMLEKDSQLQAVENSIQRAELLRLQASIEELQEQILIKEEELLKTGSQLSDTQQDITSLRSLLRKVESDAKISELNASKIHQETHDLQCQVAALMLWMESMSSCINSEPADEELDNLLSIADGQSSMVSGLDRGKQKSKAIGADCMSAEHLRRKYSAALIAAKHNPTDELLALVADLRGELQSYLLPPENGIWVG